MRNVNNKRLNFRNITTQSLETDIKKSEIIAFVEDAGMNVSADNCYT